MSLSDSVYPSEGHTERGERAWVKIKASTIKSKLHCDMDPPWHFILFHYYSGAKSRSSPPVWLPQHCSQSIWVKFCVQRMQFSLWKAADETGAGRVAFRLWLYMTSVWPCLRQEGVSCRWADTVVTVVIEASMICTFIHLRGAAASNQSSNSWKTATDSGQWWGLILMQQVHKVWM